MLPDFEGDLLINEYNHDYAERILTAISTRPLNLKNHRCEIKQAPVDVRNLPSTGALPNFRLE